MLKNSKKIDKILKKDNGQKLKNNVLIKPKCNKKIIK